MSADTRGPVVVVGGGIGGLATALALQRAGRPVRVLERGARLDGGGAGLVLSPNAQRSLRALGVEEATRSRATVLTRTVVCQPDGRALARVDLDGRGASGALLGVHRADLVEVLAAALDPGTVELGHEVADVMGVEADLVVGADGIRSVVRAAMDVDVRPTHRGYTVWRALVPSGQDLAEPATLVETWGRGERFGVVPVADGWTYVYACVNADEGEPVADDLADLRRRFAGWHAPLPALLAAVEPGTLLRHDIRDLPPGRTPLHRGRLALVGDAAHAMEPNLGQGAGLALEDAVVLAHALATAPSLDAALAGYARARAPRVAALARQSRRVGRLAQHGHPALVALRDLTLLATPPGLARRASGRATTWQPPIPSATAPSPQEIR
ncbi:FAD-dependent monooxygenase [Nocardioides astragali]|uniref:FAD-dependent monooxygenase n=1 Tax=Nocardioides astragali TaxID=1776736 RepID=A0ABW2MXY8_9ACTN|nr:FAD-dependent monooxygenase [Nocardioides astragali]